MTNHTEQTAEIDACPFCQDFGAECAQSGVIDMQGNKKYAVYCNGCFSEGPPAMTEAEAVERWNYRATLTLPAAASSSTEPERNQCDGCAVAPSVNRYGHHEMPDGSKMSCTAHRYRAAPEAVPPASCAPAVNRYCKANMCVETDTQHDAGCKRAPHTEEPAGGEAVTPANLRIGGRYNWKNQPERLSYLGMCEPRNGRWHQFAKVEEPGIVWCEVRPEDLSSFERTATPPQAPAEEPAGGESSVEFNAVYEAHCNRPITIREIAWRVWQAALATPPQAPAVPATLQPRVQPWLMACFGEMIAGDREERNHRFLEESIELVQACGCTASEAHQLVDYVFGRPVGEKDQEVGGVMITLAALCLANGLDMHDAGERELARIWTMVEKIRAKQAAKPKHSPLPEVVPAGLSDAQIIVALESISRADYESTLLYEIALVRAALAASSAPPASQDAADAQKGAA